MAGGWRLSAAVESAKKGPCLAKDCVRASCQHWCDLSSYLSSLSSEDEELRVHALKSLGALLLCLASGSDPVSSAQGYVVSIPVGGTLISVSDEDVVRLYKVLFLELAKLSRFLLSDSWCNYDLKDEKCSSLELSNTDAYVQTLCCCIRIIPVVDMFNTSLSHSGSMAVSDMFQQLCSFFPTGSLKERRHLFLRSSLLEVFLDEILLHRDSSYTLLTEGDEFVVHKGEAFPAGLKCRAAASAHMIHHHCIKGQFSVQLKDVHGVLQVSKLSLPAGVLLLDISTVNRFPNRLVAHIISLVAAALRPTGSSTLPDELAIGLALSVVETAMGLLSKHYSALEYGGRGNDDIGQHLAALLRAMSCAVLRIGAELCLVKSEGEGSLPGMGMRRGIESVAAAISFNLPSMSFIRALGCFDQKMIDAFASEDAGGAIGWAVIIFSHILFYESQRGLEEALAAEFLGVLDSLTGLLLLDSECRLAKPQFSRTLLCAFWGSSGAAELPQCAGDDINFYLQQMIKQLQRTAWDMCSRKKSTSNILSFISKVTPVQRSKSEAVNRMTPDLTFQGDAPFQEEAEPEQEQPRAVVVRRASTLAIARRFKAKAQRLEPDSSCVTSLEGGSKRWRNEESNSAQEKEDEDREGEDDAGENAFIAEMLKRDRYEEAFDDLNDFIVCKRGRCYSKFLNSRIKFRRKSHTRLIWKRREEKRSLLQALTNL